MKAKKAAESKAQQFDVRSDDDEYINARIGLKKLKTDKFEAEAMNFGMEPMTKKERKAHQ